MAAALRTASVGWFTATTQTQATFPGTPGVAYTFRVRATDRVSNISAWVQAEAKTVVVKKYYSVAGQRVAMRSNGVVHYIHGDHLGSASLTTDINGGIHAQQRYFPYGEVRWQSGSLPTDRQYTDQRREASLGIYDYKARFYSPRLGRFLSADTLVPGVGSQHLSKYMYVTGNPVRYDDPTGHAECDPGREGGTIRPVRLYTYARGLLHQDLTPMERFKDFLSYAASLYTDEEGTFDTDQFMIDVTAVINGHEHSKEAKGLFTFCGGLKCPNNADHSSPYWLGSGAFDENYKDGLTCESKGECDEGWKEQYADDSGNQAAHFWFWAAVAYFDGSLYATGGNTKHEVWDRPGNSWEDFILGELGVDLGSQLAIYGRLSLGYRTAATVGPQDIDQWIDFWLAAP